MDTKKQKKKRLGSVKSLSSQLIKVLKRWSFILGVLVLTIIGASMFLLPSDEHTPVIDIDIDIDSSEEAWKHIDEPEDAYWEAPQTPLVRPEEAVIIEPPVEEGISLLPIKKVLFEYVEVIDGCAEHFQGECVNVRSGPGTEFPVVTRLRNHVVLKISGKVERGGQSWFKIVFDESLRYPERVGSDWYVTSDYVRVVLDEGDKAVWSHEVATTTKRIVVDRSDQTLIAYDGDTVFMETAISTGLEFTPTPRGTFSVFKKTPSRYMQGPIPDISNDYYDLPGVPWNLYFTYEGAVIHGAYWHNSFGNLYSHGCVNLPPDKAKELYAWAELGTTILVED